MSLVFNEHVHETLALPCFGFVGFADDKGMPQLTRIFGYVLDESAEELRAMVFDTDLKRIEQYLQPQILLCMTLAEGLTAASVQFKGDYIERYSANEEEMAVCDQTRIQQNEVMLKFGVPDGAINAWAYKPATTIKMKIKEIYDNTPRQNTGIKIS